MSLYILVEGRRTEKAVYPCWVNYATGLVKKETPENPDENDFFIISGYGYPCIITNHLKNAIADVNLYAYDNFWIVVDADDEDIDSRRRYIQENINKYKLNPNVKVDIIIQKTCIETFGLANNSFFPKPENINAELSKFKDKYDVTTQDPALLITSKSVDGINTAGFHESYLKAIFVANGTSYTKKRPGLFKSEDFFNGIKERFQQTGHIISFSEILSAMEKL